MNGVCLWRCIFNCTIYGFIFFFFFDLLARGLGDCSLKHEKLSIKYSNNNKKRICFLANSSLDYLGFASTILLLAKPS